LLRLGAKVLVVARNVIDASLLTVILPLPIGPDLPRQPGPLLPRVSGGRSS